MTRVQGSVTHRTFHFLADAAHQILQRNSASVSVARRRGCFSHHGAFRCTLPPLQIRARGAAARKVHPSSETTTVLFRLATRVLVYLLCCLVPRLLPAKWGNVKVELRRLGLLRARGVEIKAERSVAQSVRLDDFCLFREAAWYWTLLTWVVERSFPIGLRRLEVHVRIKPLLEQTHEKSSPTVKPKDGSKIKIGTRMCRLLFQLLSRVPLDLTDVQIFLEVRLKE